MSPAHTFHPSPFLHRRPASAAAARLRRWLDRLQRVYGRAGMLELHR